MYNSFTYNKISEIVFSISFYVYVLFHGCKAEKQKKKKNYNNNKNKIYISKKPWLFTMKQLVQFEVVQNWKYNHKKRLNDGDSLQNQYPWKQYKLQSKQ